MSYPDSFGYKVLSGEIIGPDWPVIVDRDPDKPRELAAMKDQDFGFNQLGRKVLSTEGIVIGYVEDHHYPADQGSPLVDIHPGELLEHLDQLAS